jgi:hypothetical protein
MMRYTQRRRCESKKADVVAARYGAESRVDRFRTADVRGKEVLDLYTSRKTNLKGSRMAVVLVGAISKIHQDNNSRKKRCMAP